MDAGENLNLSLNAECTLGPRYVLSRIVDLLIRRLRAYLMTNQDPKYLNDLWKLDLPTLKFSQIEQKG